MLKLNLSNWVNRTETAEATFEQRAAQTLAATLGQDVCATTDVMPPLAHWCAFTPLAPTDALGPDGHPATGGFLPNVGLPRRMWAGGALTFHAPLRVGQSISRRSTITSITEKEGAAGSMVFVKLTHELSQSGTLAVTETQDIVYLPMPETFSPPPKKPVPDTPDFCDPVAMSAALLFRFSAVTFNAHRIHYDLPYAMDIEKYPGLVVHGPLQAMLLMNGAMHHTGKRPKQFSFRGIHPLFHFDDLHVMGQATDDGLRLCTGLRGGHQGMQANIIWED